MNSKESKSKKEIVSSKQAPTLYEKRIKAMELAIKSQRGAPHHTTLIKVADEIYKWLNIKNNES